MKKVILIVIVSVICICGLLSGCQDTSSVKTQQQTNNVYLDSPIVEFANVSFEKNVNDSGGVESVTVGWLFHNKAGRMVSANINAKFYDKNNLLLYSDNTHSISNMPPGFTEHLFSASNKVTYEGAGAAFVDHVVLTVTEI